jgi:hypothetical protein
MQFIQETGNKSSIFKQYSHADFSTYMHVDRTVYAFIEDGFFFEFVFDFEKKILYWFQQLQFNSSTEEEVPHSLFFKTQLNNRKFIFNPIEIALIPVEFFGNDVPRTDFSEYLIHSNKVVMSSKNEELNLKSITPDFSFVDATLKYVVSNKENHFENTKNTILITKNKNIFHLVLLKGKDPLFVNTFPASSNEEMLYFVLSVISDFGILQDNTEVIVVNFQLLTEETITFFDSYFAKVTGLEYQIAEEFKQKSDISFLTEKQNLHYYLYFTASQCELQEGF